MATKSVHRIDDQGRVVLPSHIRKALNLQSRSAVSVSLDDDGTIRLRAEVARCCICGESVEGKHHTHLSDEKLICFDCAQKVARAMMK